MFEIILIAVIGSVLAGLWDLKTTEVPDEIPALMIGLGLFLWFMRYMGSGDASIFYSLTIGTLLLVVGLLMYRKSQWGAADAWVLAAIGYLIPFYNGRLFIVDFIPNFLIVAMAYMIVYVFILGLKEPHLFSLFLQESGKRKKIVLGVPLAFLAFVFIMFAFLSPAASFNIYPLITSLLLIVFLTLFWSYAKVVEKYAFRKKIPTSKLREGDVLEKMIWRGLTKDEVIEIRKKMKFVTIKEGVRFVPVFPIALIVTLLFGNLFLLLL